MKKIAILIAWVPFAAFAAGGPQVTIYNDGFATVKEDRALALAEGVSEVRVTDMSRQLEPDSVLLRELSPEPFGVKILEQSFINDPLTEGLLLYQMEGKTLRFEEKREDGTVKEHTGKLIRSGYVPGGGDSEEPIVEEDGAVRFSLPGQPVFEGIDPNAFLKPSLVWQIAAKKAGECPIEVAYVTAGMSWEATYSLVAPAEGSDLFDLSGWISLQNHTGKTFANADIKLIAGDVQKAQAYNRGGGRRYAMKAMAFSGAEEAMPEERAFDEFHLYTLPRPVLLRNNELKQVEFIRASGVKGNRYYVYNPLVGYRYGGGRNEDPDYGITESKKVGVRIEISNSETNQLGVPLPKGRMRLYRTDSVDGRREFTGENQMDHLPKNELLKLDMGSAFDLVGERKRVDFSVDSTGKRMTESFEIKLRNRKEKDAVEIRVVEPLYRCANWKITAKSLDFTKIDANTVEFRAPVPADGETVLTYTVQYSW
ncbi:MAG TPA: hypothetical protein DCM68_08815 [Verrucomicrobia bacterium]|nr:hypothetical protein [Verrucomicrobiota bacterium]